MFDPNTPKKLQKIFGKYKKVVLVGSATGGHVIPLINLAKLVPALEYHALVGARSLEEDMMSTHHIPHTTLHIQRVGEGGLISKISYLLSLVSLFFEGYKTLKHLRSGGYHTLFSKGGPGSIALTAAARLLGYHLIIHESDLSAGSGNRLVSHYAHQILSGFGQSSGLPTDRLTPVGQILDPVFYQRDMTLHQKSQWKTKNLPRILVICGSQGSESIFRSLSMIKHPEDYEFHIILGRLNHHMRASFDHFAHIHLHEWLGSTLIAELIHSSDIIITRGSATTLAEVSTGHAHLIIVPLPSAAHDHQLLNARFYEGLGHTLLRQDRLDELSTLLKKLTKKRS